MIMKMVSGIQECEEKYLLKLRIQQDIVNTCFSINQTNITQGLMPLTLLIHPYLYSIVGHSSYKDR